MSREMPDPWPLWLAKQRQSDLIREADQYHLAKEAKQYRLATAHPGEPAGHFATLLLNGIRGLGRWSASVRRTLSRPEAPCNDPCQDCALC